MADKLKKENDRKWHITHDGQAYENSQISLSSNTVFIKYC